MLKEKLQNLDTSKMEVTPSRALVRELEKGIQELRAHPEQEVPSANLGAPTICNPYS